MRTYFNEIILLGTFIISIVALIISVKAYSRGTSIDLQNQLHLKKLESCEFIISEFLSLLTLFEKSLEKLNSLDMSKKPIGELLELNKLADQIDLEIIKGRKRIAIKSAYFPSKFSDKLLISLDGLFEQIDMKSTNSQSQSIIMLTKHIEDQQRAFDSIIIQMRADLGLDQLNSKLMKRVKKGAFSITSVNIK